VLLLSLPVESDRRKRAAKARVKQKTSIVDSSRVYVLYAEYVHLFLPSKHQAFPSETDYRCPARFRIVACCCKKEKEKEGGTEGQFERETRTRSREMRRTFLLFLYLREEKGKKGRGRQSAQGRDEGEEERREGRRRWT